MDIFQLVKNRPLDEQIRNTKKTLQIFLEKRELDKEKIKLFSCL